jgi:hypothetical protein
MTTLYLILYILAAVCFIAAAVLAYRPVVAADANGTVHTAGRVNLVALGLFFWVLVPLIVTARNL